MQIRFQKFTPAGSVQFQPGELVDLPAQLAQEFIDDGNALAVPKAEAAVLRFEPASAYPEPRRPQPRGSSRRSR